MEDSKIKDRILGNLNKSRERKLRNKKVKGGIVSLLTLPFRLVMMFIAWIFIPHAETSYQRLFRGVVKTAPVVFLVLFNNEFSAYIINASGDLGYFLYPILSLLIIGIALDGILNMKTWRVGALSTFDSNYWFTPGSGNDEDPNQKNINDVLRYRESRMGSMGAKEAANLYRETQGTINNASYGKNSRTALNFMNSRLGSMGNKEGLNYLRGKRD